MKRNYFFKEKSLHFTGLIEGFSVNRRSPVNSPFSFSCTDTSSGERIREALFSRLLVSVGGNIVIY